MVPKKFKVGKKGKKGGKKGKKGKKKGKKGKKLTKEPGTELTKEILKIQVETLQEKLDRCKNNLDESEKNRSELQEKYDNLRKDLDDILKYQKFLLCQQSSDNQELIEKITGVHTSWIQDKDLHDKNVNEIVAQFQEEKEKLSNEIIALSGKLASLEEFKIQREEYNNKLTKLKTDLQESEEKRQDEVYNLDKKYIKDKDKLKKDMVVKLQKIATEFRSISNKQMADTTKRALQENVYLSKQVAKLGEDNSTISKKSRMQQYKIDQLQRQMQLSHEREQQQAQRTQVLTRVIGMLTDKYKIQENIVKELTSHQNQLSDLHNEFSNYKLQVSDELASYNQIKDENQHLLDQLSEKDEELAAVRSEKHRVDHLLYQTARALQKGLALADETGSDLEQIRADRNDMFARVLLLLNEADEIIDVFSESGSSSTRPPSSTMSSPITLFRLKTGDLGLVPYPPGEGSEFEKPTKSRPKTSIPSSSRPASSKKSVTRPYSHPIKNPRTH